MAACRSKAAVGSEVMRMVRRITRTGAGLGGSANSFARRGFGKSVAFVGRMALLCALFASTVPASAQISGIGTEVSVPGTVVTTTTTLNTVSSGTNGQGYFVA